MAALEYDRHLSEVNQLRLKLAKFESTVNEKSYFVKLKTSFQKNKKTVLKPKRSSSKKHLIIISFLIFIILILIFDWIFFKNTKHYLLNFLNLINSEQILNNHETNKQNEDSNTYPTQDKSYFSKYDDIFICKKASIKSFSGNKVWDYQSNSIYVIEAKVRNLSCGVSDQNSKSTNISNEFIDVSKFSNYVICLRSNWVEEAQPYREEAVKRKLDCK